MHNVPAMMMKFLIPKHSEMVTRSHISGSQPATAATKRCCFIELEYKFVHDVVLMQFLQMFY